MKRLMILAACLAVTACAGTYISAEGGKRAAPGANYSEGFRP